MGVVFLQRVAGPTGILARALRALMFGTGFVVTEHPDETLSGAQGDGEVTGFLRIDQLVAASFFGVTGLQQTAQTGATDIGAIIFDPSALAPVAPNFTRTVKLVAVLECGTSGQTNSLELYNLTDGVSVVTITTSATAPTIVTSGALTLPNSQKLYILRMSRTGGTSTDFVACKLARLEVADA